MAKNTKQIVTIEDFKVTNLAEFQGKKETQEQLVKDNPYIEIVDTETYNTAKKHRTALVTGRTSLNKEKTYVAKRIKEIIVEPVATAYDELIAITTPHENKQQEEVKRYEAEKEEERRRKEREEQERIDAILQKINVIVHVVTIEINSLSYDQSLTYQIKPMYQGKEVNEEDFQEYASKYVSEIEALNFTLEQRKSFLAAEEQNRLNAIELQKQRDEQNRIDAIKAAIFNFNSKWQRIIANLTEDTINNVVDQFNAILDEDYQEFQSEYVSTKEMIELALNNRIAQIQQQVVLEKQQQQNKIIQRRGLLASLGFDYNTLTYSNFGIELTVIEDDLKTPDNVFNLIIESVKQRVFEASQPKPEPNPEPVKEEEILKEEVQQPPVNNTTFQDFNKVSEPEQKFSKNQVRSIDFLTNFVAYCEIHISTPIDLNIKNFVLSNVK